MLVCFFCISVIQLAELFSAHAPCPVNECSLGCLFIVACVLLTSSLSGFEISAMKFLYYALMWHDVTPVCCAAAICSSRSALDSSRLFGISSHTKTNKSAGILSGCRVSERVLDFLQHLHQSFHIAPRPWQVLGSNPPESSRALHWNDVSHPGLGLCLDTVKHTVSILETHPAFLTFQRSGVRMMTRSWGMHRKWPF